MSTYTSILQAALKLSAQERSQLAETLLETVDEMHPGRPQLSEAWRSEIARRSAEIDAGTATFVTAEQMRERARRAAGHDG